MNKLPPIRHNESDLRKPGESLVWRSPDGSMLAELVLPVTSSPATETHPLTINFMVDEDGNYPPWPTVITFHFGNQAPANHYIGWTAGFYPHSDTRFTVQGKITLAHLRLHRTQLWVSLNSERHQLWTCDSGYLCEGGAACPHGSDSTHWVDKEDKEKQEGDSMQLFNLTPHSIVVGGITLPQCPDPPRLVQVSKPIGAISHLGQAIPVVVKILDKEKCHLPPPVKGRGFVVSLAIAQAFSERNDLFVTANPICDDSGRVIGWRSLATVAQSK